MEAKLIKIDRNGSKHYEGIVKCDRCGGDGLYKWGAVINGAPQYVGTCFKCNGAGKVIDTWIERTPEYEAKLAEKRAARQAKRYAEIAAREAEREAAWQAEQARRAAEKAISQYVGTVGERVQFTGTYLRSGSWEQRSYRGFGTDTMYAHTFADASGNKFVWKTQSHLNLDPDTPVTVSGTVKEHSTFADEKQTSLTRCKVTP